MNIKGLKKEAVLAALYNASKLQGMGFLHYNPKPMTEAEAAELLKRYEANPYFDYLYGRVMKIEISGDELDTGLYNRDNGIDAAEKVIEELKKTNS